MDEAPSIEESGKTSDARKGDSALPGRRTPRILLFHPVMWSHYKGVVFSALFEACNAADLSLHVVQVSYTVGQRAFLGDVDAGVHRYPYQLLFEGPYDHVPLWRRVHRVLGVVLAERWDVLILPGYYEPAMWFAAVVGKLRGAKIIIESDSTYHDHVRWQPRERLKGLLVKFCDLAMCYGTRARTYVVSLGMPVERTLLRCQATANDEIGEIHAEMAEKREELVRILGIPRRNFIFVGRLSPEKNVGNLIKAFSRIADDVDGWGLLIVGAGPEQPALMAMTPEDLRARVVFVGGKGWREVPQYFAVADVLVLPSLSEPWGLVVNEALICGLPVLVSERCGCVPEIVIDGKTGFSFDPENVDQLARLMLDIARNDATRANLAIGAMRVAAEYTPERSAREMCNGLLRILPATRVKRA